MGDITMLLILALYLALGVYFDLNRTFVKSVSWSLFGFIFGILVSAAMMFIK